MTVELNYTGHEVKVKRKILFVVINNHIKINYFQISENILFNKTKKNKFTYIAT